MSNIHNINDNLRVTILQNNIKTAAAPRYHKDKWICRHYLKTLAPHGLNTEIVDNAKEMYNFSINSIRNSVISFDIYVHMIMKNMTDLNSD